MTLARPVRKLARWLGRVSGWRRAAVLVVAGAVLSLALGPAYVWPVTFVCFPVLAWLLDGWCPADLARSRRLWRGFAAGWLFAFGYFLVSLYWIGEAFLVDAGQYAVLLPLAVLAMPAGLALFWGLAVAVAAAVSRPGAERYVSLAITLGVTEWLRGWVLTGFPWNAAGYLLTGIAGVEQAAAVTGLYGLGLLSVLWGVSPALLASPARRDLLLALAALASLLAVTGWGDWRLAHHDTAADNGFEVIIVQADIAQRLKWDPTYRDATIKRYFDLARAVSPRADPPADGRKAIMVWPESALPVLVDENPQLVDAMADLLRPGDMLLLGSLRRIRDAAGGQQAYNSIFAIDADANIVARYDKQHLVPFGEYLPLAPVMERLGLRKLVPLPLGFAAGAGPVNLAAGDLPPFAPLICYEAIFPYVSIDRSSRPAWILNVTNDGWFGRTAGPHQHFAQVRMRAIEEGLPVVRAANTGISAVIDSLGRPRAVLGLGKTGTLRAALPGPAAPTVFSVYGNWTFFALLTLSLIVKLSFSRLGCKKSPVDVTI